MSKHFSLYGFFALAGLAVAMPAKAQADMAIPPDSIATSSITPTGTASNPYTIDINAEFMWYFNSPKQGSGMEMYTISEFAGICIQRYPYCDSEVGPLATVDLKYPKLSSNGTFSNFEQAGGIGVNWYDGFDYATGLKGINTLAGDFQYNAEYQLGRAIPIGDRVLIPNIAVSGTLWMRNLTPNASVTAALDVIAGMPVPHSSDYLYLELAAGASAGFVQDVAPFAPVTASFWLPPGPMGKIALTYVPKIEEGQKNKRGRMSITLTATVDELGASAQVPVGNGFHSQEPKKIRGWAGATIDFTLGN
jgi:hypothetical protein